MNYDNIIFRDLEDNMNALTAKIEQWAIHRGLHSASADKQTIKLFEEAGELAQGMAKGNDHQIKDSIGDMYVVMTILCMQLDIDIKDCVGLAYDEIKNRTGKLVDGVWIKSDDL